MAGAPASWRLDAGWKSPVPALPHATPIFAVVVRCIPSGVGEPPTHQRRSTHGVDPTVKLGRLPDCDRLLSLAAMRVLRRAKWFRD